MIERERHGDVVLLRLAHGKASALDLELLEAIALSLREEAAGDARAIVLTGTGRIFCAGVDLHRLLAEGAPYVRRFLPALDEALLAPLRCEKPVVAAVNGHAIAGGCVLAWATDWRLLVHGDGRLGVPELKVGVPFPVVPFEISRAAIPRAWQRAMLYGGELCGPPEALARGLVDELCEPEALLTRALARGEELAAIPRATFAATKRLVLTPLLRRVQHELAEEQRIVEQIWSRPDILEAVRAYVERTLPRRG